MKVGAQPDGGHDIAARNFRATELFQSAAHARGGGNVDAIFQLGVCNYAGFGMTGDKPNYDEALR